MRLCTEPCDPKLRSSGTSRPQNDGSELLATIAINIAALLRMGHSLSAPHAAGQTFMPWKQGMQIKLMALTGRSSQQARNSCLRTAIHPSSMIEILTAAFTLADKLKSQLCYLLFFCWFQPSPAQANLS